MAFELGINENGGTELANYNTVLPNIVRTSGHYIFTL